VGCEEWVGCDEWVGCVGWDGWLEVGSVDGSCVVWVLVGADDGPTLDCVLVGTDDGPQVGWLEGRVDDAPVVGGVVPVEPGAGTVDDEAMLVGPGKPPDEVGGSAMVPDRTAEGVPLTTDPDDVRGANA
jgi:hypothetical protein